MNKGPTRLHRALISGARYGGALGRGLFGEFTCFEIGRG